MSDDRMRDLERRANQGDAESQARHLQERIRAGEISEQTARLAAQMGHPAARLLFADDAETAMPLQTLAQQATPEQLLGVMVHMVAGAHMELAIAIQWASGPCPDADAIHLGHDDIPIIVSEDLIPFEAFVESPSRMTAASLSHAMNVICEAGENDNGPTVRGAHFTRSCAEFFLGLTDNPAYCATNAGSEACRRIYVELALFLASLRRMSKRQARLLARQMIRDAACHVLIPARA